MSKHLPIEWYRGCTTPDQKKDREDHIRNSTYILGLVLRILQEKYAAIDRKGFKEEDYAESGWVTLQAFRNGKLAQLDELGELFAFMEPDKGNK